MKHFLLMLLYSVPVVACLAQSRNGTIEGVVVDSSGVGLPTVTVVLLQQQDSIMAAFNATDQQGHFLLKRIAPGNYVLQASCLGYQRQSKNITITPENNRLDVGKILLIPSTTLLDAVEISGIQAPLSIHKDTIEYNAGAFKTQPGSVVEDLLKKLPGVQVGSDGSITAQGERVQNVLIDGKEFFGQDPKIATKNLPAEAVDKVQVYDQKSEKATFTGIEDGQEQKTINLKLKEDHKQGYFGNANGGYGSQNRFEGKFNVNRFNKKTQISALGMGNNTNQQGFSFDDYINLMGGLSNFMSGTGSTGSGGRVRLTIDPEASGIPMGFGLENGFTNTWAGGLNLNSDLSPKTTLSTNYFYSRLQNNMERVTTRENLLGDQNFRSFEQENRLSRNASHRVNVTLRHKIDSSSNLIFKSGLSINDARLQNLGNSQTTDAANQLQNTGSRQYASDGLNLHGNATLTYRKRLGRKGRSLVTDAFFQSGDDLRDANLLAQNDYLSGANPFSETILQRQHYTDVSNNFGGSVAYTEPLGHRQYLEWMVAHRQYANRTFKDFYDRFETPTPGEVFNPLLSNRFRRGYRYDRGSMNYMVNREKYNLTAGAALQHSELAGEQLLGNAPNLQRGFTRVLPSLFFNYDFKRGRNISVEYTTELQEPSLEQLQPVVDNSDPLNIYTGNPDLKPAYAHDLNLQFLNFDQFMMSSFFASAAATYIRDRISNASTIDAQFRRNTRPINVKQDLMLRGYMNYSTPIRMLKSTLQASLSTTYNRGILFVNDLQNNTDRWMNTLEVSLDNRQKDKVDLIVGTRLTQNTTQYSISASLNQAFINQTYFTDISVFPSKKWAFGSGLDYTVYSGETFGARQIVPLWRASLTRYVLKNNRGQIKLAAFDLLNRNVSINRSSQFNYIEEVRVRNLGRYALLSFAYSLSGFEKKPMGGIQINMH